jgi:putative heme-binding domain-containing protein
VVTLKNGKVLTGLLASETATSVTLTRADKQNDVVLRDDIEPDGIVSTGKSLMPEGLEKGMSIQDFADLLAFLRNWRELKMP